MPTLFITGANRGLGLEAVKQYSAAGWTIHATCRDPSKASELRAQKNVTVHALDVKDFAATDALAAKLEGTAIDVLFANAGRSKPAASEFGKIDYADWMETLTVNTLAPFKLVEAFVGHVEASQRKTIAVVSSIMGSMGKAYGKSYPYRSSKAGLNAAIVNLNIDLKPRGICFLMIHPGWVRTDMGGPKAHIDAVESVRGMRAVVERAGPETSGRFFQWDGQELPW